MKRWDEENFDCRFIEKNEERRKAAPALRRVSVPSDLTTVVPVGSMTIQSSKADLHPVVENQRMEDTGPFLVSFPLSIFMLSEVAYIGCSVVKAENDNPPFYVGYS